MLAVWIFAQLKKKHALILPDPGLVFSDKGEQLGTTYVHVSHVQKPLAFGNRKMRLPRQNFQIKKATHNKKEYSQHSRLKYTHFGFLACAIEFMHFAEVLL